MILIKYFYTFAAFISLTEKIGFCESVSQENSTRDVVLSVESNVTGKLIPSENVELNFTLTRTNETYKVENISLHVQFPSQELYILKAAMLDDVNTESLTFNRTHMTLVLSSWKIGQSKQLTISTRSVTSLSKNKIITMDYRIVYQLSSSNSSLSKSFSFVKTLYSFSDPSYLKVDFIATPTLVQGEDKINHTIVITNKNSTSLAYDMQISLKLESTNITQISCSQSSSNVTQSILQGLVYINATKLESNTTLRCLVHGFIETNITPGARLSNNLSVVYYHKPKAPDLYPFQDSLIKYIDVMPVTADLLPSLNISKAIAGMRFNLSVSMGLPNSQSPLVLRILLPVYRLAARKRRSISLVSSPSIPFVQFLNQRNLTLQTGSSIQLSNQPTLHYLDNSTLVINFGVVTSNVRKNANNSSSEITVAIELLVVNDPVNLSGRGSVITVCIGMKNFTLPIYVAGPILKPILLIQKYVQIIDINRDSPLLNFTIVVKHGNQSTIAAGKIMISDATENILLYSRLVKPNGVVSVAKNYQTGYIISTVVDELKDSEVAILEYQGAFAKGSQVNQAKWKAAVTWKSIQANSPTFGPEYSQEVCLSTVKKVITKKETQYAMIALGVVLGLILGALSALLVLYCMKRTKAAKPFVFLDLLKTQDDEESSDDLIAEKQEARRPFSFKNSILNRQTKQTPSSVNCCFDGDDWAFMAAVKYEKSIVENARYRTLLEELLRGHKSSFLFFVDSIVQIISLIAVKLKNHGDISAETMSKMQLAANGVLTSYRQKSKQLDHAVIASCTNLTEMCQQCMAEDCELVRSSVRETSKLFETFLPKKLNEDMEKEIRHMHEELRRMAFNKSNEIKQLVFLHVREVDVCRFGKMNILAWSAKTFDLWSTWLSKKLSREIDIILRKRLIQDIDAKVLNKNIAALLKEGENAFTRELTQRVSVLQRERLPDNANLLKSMDDKLQMDLINLEREAAGLAAKSLKDGSAYMLNRYQMFVEREKGCQLRLEQNQNQIYDAVEAVVKELRVKCMSQIMTNVEMMTIKLCSQIASNKDGNADDVSMADSNESEDSQTRGEGLKMILECVEDLQADLSGVETEDKSLIENFVEEIQEASEHVKKTALDRMDDFCFKIEDIISQSRFKFKSLLFALRDISEEKAQSIIASWMPCLQKTLAEIYMRKDLEHYESQQNSKKEDNKQEENVIFWFKYLETITRSEFKKVRATFTDYVEEKNKLCQSIFENNAGGFEKITKSVIAYDVEQDFVSNIKTSCFTREFLICQQFLTTLIHTLDEQQFLSDPEVKECFVQLKKAVRLLTKSEVAKETNSDEVTKEKMADLLVDFHNHCDSLQPQRQSSIVSKIEDMIFNEEKIIEKIHKVMKAKKKQNELMSVMEKLQIENIQALSSLVRMDKVSQSDMMNFVKALYMNVPKKRFDEIMKSIHGQSQQDFLATYLRFQLQDTEKEVSPAMEPEREQEPDTIKKKKKKKNHILKKNTVVPDK